MNQRTYRAVRPALLAPAVLMSTLWLATPAGATTPPPASEYQALPVCHAPAPGHASCLALTLAPRTAVAPEHARPQGMTRGIAVGMASSAERCAQIYPVCLTPTDLNDAYFPGEKPEAPESEPQTIALVDAYDDPNAEGDLKIYDEEFNLPACTEQNGCFKKINQQGETGHPPTTKDETEKEEAEGWALEISTDIETAHGVCQNCHIVLVEAENPSYENLVAAENTAAEVVDASEISNSWGGSEAELTDTEIAAFNHPGTVVTASAGDDGYLNWDQLEGESLELDEPNFPASSPDVLAVGGTELTVSSAGAWEDERVWNEDPDLEGKDEGAAGGGCSLRFSAPAWQRAVTDWPTVGCEGRRAVADVSADADPDTGLAVYDSVPYPYEEKGKKKTEVLDWVPVGGTSLASPIIASMFALAGGAHGIAYPAATLYTHLGASLLHDVTAGGNGECDDDYSACSGSMKPLSPFDCGENALICNAAVGYDGPTGVGTPDGVGAFTTTGKGESGGGDTKSKAGGSGSGGGEEPPVTGAGSTSGGALSSPSGAGNAALAPATATTPADIHAPIPVLSALTLTPNAFTALSHNSQPNVSQVAFAFTLNVAAHVRVTLAKLVVGHGHKRWQTLPCTLTVTAAKGRNRDHLSARGRLTPGRYRLTLTPAHGDAQTLTFPAG